MSDDEPPLPYSLSNTGRVARVGYLGFDGVSFNDLWPIFAGAVCSVLLALKLFVADSEGGWLAKTCVAAAPSIAGFAYLKYFVVERPPHFKGDLLDTAICIRFGLAAHPFLSLPIPRIYLDACFARGPARAADSRNPLRRPQG